MLQEDPWCLIHSSLKVYPIAIPSFLGLFVTNQLTLLHPPPVGSVVFLLVLID